jgi:PadR family transcriptional regulator PadR
VPESIQVQLKKGILELCVLFLLSEGDAYAYEIASRLVDEIGMGEGTIYPLMRRMEKDGLVGSYLVASTAGGAPRKYYRLTRSGKAAFVSQHGEWSEFERCVRKFLGAKA